MTLLNPNAEHFNVSVKQILTLSPIGIADFDLLLILYWDLMAATRLILIILFCLGGWEEAFSQSEYTPFTPISDPVLNQNSIYDILQDSTGFIWIGTYNGLYRYDGYTFKGYQGNPLDSNSLFPGPVKNICLDEKGNLWLNILGSGIAYMDLKSGKITRYPYKLASKTGPQSATISDMKLDRDGNLWMTSYNNGICKRDNKRGIFIYYPEGQKGLPTRELVALHIGPDGSVWVGLVEKGLYVYDPWKDVFYPFNIKLTAFATVNAIYLDKSGILWVASDSGTHIIQRAGKKYITTVVPTPNDSKKSETFGQTSIVKDSRGKIWIGSFSRGLFVYDEKTNKTVRYIHNPINPNSIGSNLVNKIFEDRNGNIWIGSSNGLSKMNAFQRELNLYSFGTRGNTDNRIKDVRSIYKDGSGLWMGTAGDGLLLLSPEGRVKKFKFDSTFNQPISNNVNCILNDGKGNLLLGTGRGLHVFNLLKQKSVDNYFWYLTFPLGKAYLQCIWSLQLLNSDSVLLGTKDSGLICLNLKTRAYKRYPVAGASENKFVPYSVWYIYRDNNGKIWLGTSFGLAL